MSVTAEQKEAVVRWIRSGATLADVQKRLGEEFQLNLTYMDVRFLVDDLDLQIADTKAKTPPPDLSKLPPAGAPNAGAQPGKVKVAIDQVTRPGALVSGSVTFSDGQKAQWFFDQMGRLGLNPSTPGYKPKEQDLAAFQRELQAAVEARGGF